MIEKFLAVLTALVAAIEANTAALKARGSEAAPAEEKKGRGSKTETKTEGKPETKIETPAGPTVADLRAAAQALLDANGNDGSALTELNKKYGTKRISEVPAEKYAEVIAALKDLTEKAKASGGI